MALVGRYISSPTLGTFLMLLVSLTSVIRLPQALRDIDPLNNQGQAVVMLAGIAILMVPMLILLIVPVGWMTIPIGVGRLSVPCAPTWHCIAITATWQRTPRAII